MFSWGKEKSCCPLPALPTPSAMCGISIAPITAAGTGQLIYQLLNSQESPAQLGSPRPHRGLFCQGSSFPHLSRQRCIFHAFRTVREFQALAWWSGADRLGCLHQCEGFTGEICSIRSSSSSLASQWEYYLPRGQ